MNWIAGAAVGAAMMISAGGCAWLPLEEEVGFEEVVQRAGGQVFPAVVYIRAVRSDLEGGKNDASVVSGSGVLLSVDGELLTNNHVIEKTREIRCQLHDGRAFSARVIGSDKDLDVALLKLELPEGTEPLPVARLSDVPVSEGEFVMAMGAPWGMARSVSVGIISCANRYLPGTGDYTLWYQTDASISPGNSGGPLVNTAGEVVGLNTRATMLGGPIGFTLPARTIMDVLGRLREYGSANWAWFGFQLQPLHDFDRNVYFDYDRGVIVAGTDIGSPARRAGFLTNDRIVAIDGREVTAVDAEDIPAIMRMLGLMEFDREAVFTLFRDGREMQIALKPRAKGAVEGEEMALKRWGFTVKTINRFDNPDLFFHSPEGGVFIYGIDWLGNASDSQLRVQDVILTIDGEPVKTLEDIKRIYERAMENIGSKTRVSIGVLRHGRPVQLVLNYLNDYNKDE